MAELSFYRVTISCDYHEDVIVLAEDEIAAKAAAEEAEPDVEVYYGDPQALNPENEDDRAEIEDEDEIPYGATYDLANHNMTCAEIVNRMVAAKVFRCHPVEGQKTMFGIDPKPIPFPVEEGHDEDSQEG